MSVLFLRLASFLIFLVFIFHGCSETGILDSSFAPAFTWIKYELNDDKCDSQPYRILWGSSERDIYILGNLACFAEYDLMHFDGWSWQPVQVSKSNEASLSANCIIGFSANNIWMAGTAPISDQNLVDMIWRYNGIDWSRLPPPYLIRSNGYLSTMYGDRPDNIWAGGNYGTLYHYNGTFWSRDSLNIPNPLPLEEADKFVITTITGDPNHGYYLKASARSSAGGVKDYLFKHEKFQWSCIDSGWDYRVGRIYISPEGTLFGGGNNIYRWDGQYWRGFYGGMDNYVNDLHVINDIKIFATINGPVSSTLAFYDGRNWVEYDELTVTGIWYYDVLYINREIFVLGQTEYGKIYSIVWHGRPSQ